MAKANRADRCSLFLVACAAAEAARATPSLPHRAACIVDRLLKRFVDECTESLIWTRIRMPNSTAIMLDSVLPPTYYGPT
jgi:hypothetical protein